MEELKIVNGSYDYTQIYLLYQLLNEISTGNNHNQNIVDVLNQINGKNNNDIIAAIGNIPQVNLNEITTLLNQIKNKEIPTTDLSGILAAINNLDTTVKYNLPTDYSQILNQILNKQYPTIPQADYSSIINAIKQIPSYNDSNVVNAINGINIPQVDLKPVIDAINALKTQPTNENININIEQVKTCPQKTVYEITNVPLPKGKVVKVTESTKYVTPAPKVVKITNNAAHIRICGTVSPNGEYAKCIECVNNFLNKNKNAGPKELTRQHTGCRCKIK
jgi:hypothetical protein